MERITKAVLEKRNQQLEAQLNNAHIRLAVTGQLFAMIKELLDRASRTTEETSGPESDPDRNP